MKFKGNQIQITSEKDLTDLESKLSQVQAQYVSFVIFTLTTIINEYIVDPIHESMRGAGVSRKIIDRTYLDVRVEQKGKEVTFHIKSDFITDTGFPVAKIIEFGRKAYTIKPVRKKLLKWLNEGKWVSKHEVKIPKKDAGLYIFNAIKKGQPKVQKELNKRTKKWVSNILKS